VEGAPPTRLTALARGLVRTVTDRTRVELAAAGFSDVRPVHNLVLAQVEGGGARITDLADRAGITKQAVTLMVDHLERGGYVARVADPSDRRAKLVVLTDRGRAAAVASLRIAEEIERGWTQRLGAGRLAELKRALAELVDGLDRDRQVRPETPGAAPGAKEPTG
jgi:DNA-binding MarR family transcriptional regulator